MGRVSDAKERLMEAVKELMWTGSYGSTTIDHICEKAGVKKGSFYYFFDSKAELAETALDEDWESRRPELDSIFSATVPPLARLKKYCDMGYKIQAEMHAKHGVVLGCPLFCIGAEVSTQEDRLQKKIGEILEYKRKYLESVIREAHAAGLVHAPDPAAKSRALMAYYQGILTQARIQNDLSVIREAHKAILDFLGVKESELATAI
jgi:TetR/AcrR family transcriptional regulator, transcriptional repressor for nem operon